MVRKRSLCSEDCNISSSMLATLPFPMPGDFGRAGIMDTGHLTNDNLDQQIGMAVTGTSGIQCYYSTDNEKKITWIT